jgi:RHS repeat-associated protein
LALASVEETASEEGDTFSRRYDGPSRTWTTTSPEGRTVRTTVDGQGRPVQTEVAEVIPVALTYDGRGRIEEVKQGDRSLAYAYDATSGYLAAITDATSRKVLYQRDAAARPTSITAPDDAKLSLVFDPHDNVTSVTPPGKGTHAFAYTPDDHESAYTPPKSAATTTTYDADRRPLVTTRPDASTWTRAYDVAGRLSSFAYPGATLTPTYDDKGHLAAIAGPGAESLAATYDGPLVTSLSITGVATGTLAWTYDTRFRPNREEGNGAFPVAVSFDHDGLPTDIGDLALVREPTTGRVSEAIVSYGVTTTFAYTPYGEVASANTKAGETPVLDLAFTYDVLGRIVEKKDTGVTWAYGYDLAGRLANVKKDGVSVATYTYDANGNRLTGGATYDEEDRQLTGDGATFTYTPNGERKTRVDGNGTTTYGYDGRGHLTSVALPNGKQLAYGVDALGRRVSRSENGVITHRWLFRSQLQPVAEIDASGEVTTRYVYGTKVNVPDYFVRGGVTYAVLTDQLGSVRKVVDAGSGETVQEMDYDAWGVVTKDTNPGFQPFGFAGGVWDAASGLVHFGAREYEPATGRWTRKDPIGFGGGENQWSYVAGSPTSAVDPEGTLHVVVVSGLAGGLAGGIASAAWQQRATGRIDPATTAIAFAGGAVAGALAPWAGTFGGGYQVLANAGIGATANFLGSIALDLAQDCADIGWDRAQAAAVDGAIGGMLAGAVTRVPSPKGPRFPWGNLVRGTGDTASDQLARGFWTPRSAARIAGGAALSNGGVTPPEWFSGAPPQRR